MKVLHRHRWLAGWLDIGVYYHTSQQQSNKTKKNNKIELNSQRFIARSLEPLRLIMVQIYIWSCNTIAKRIKEINWKKISKIDLIKDVYRFIQHFLAGISRF